MGRFLLRTAIIVGVVLALAVSLLLLALPLGQWTGARDWSRQKQELEARGEKRLMLADFEKPRIPDEENFFGDPLWQPPERDEGGRAFVPIRKLLPPFTGEELGALGKRFPGFQLPTKGARRQSAIVKQGAKLSKAGEQKASEAELTLALLQPASAYLDRIEAFCPRPGAWYPIDYSKNFDLELPHVLELLAAAQLFSARAQALLAAHRDPARAFRDLQIIFRLQRALEDQPSLIAWLVRVSICQIGIVVIHRALEARCWNEGELRAIDRELAGVDVIAALPESLRQERGVFNQMVADIGRPAPRAGGLFGFDQARFNRLIQEWIDRIERSRTEGFVGEPSMASAANEESFLRYFYPLTRMVAAGFTGAETKGLDTQNRLAMARVACALERWRVSHGEFPEKLDELVPVCFDALPVDVVDRRPPRYRRLPEGGYRLYSVALNREDDGGEAKKNKDWVWGVPPERAKGTGTVD